MNTTNTLRAFTAWILTAAALVLGGCATSGSLTTTMVGKHAKQLADVSVRNDVSVTKAGADVPTSIVRVGQVGFFDPTTGALLPVPDGLGGILGIARSVVFDTTDTMMMRALPAMLNTLTGVVGQGVVGERLAKKTSELQRQCIRDGTCLQGPSTVVNAVSGSSSGSQALIEGVTLSLLNQLGCAAAGTCPSVTTPQSPPPAKTGGN